MNNETIINDTYPFTRSFYLITAIPPSKNADLFLKFITSSEGQALLTKEGLISVDEINAVLNKKKQ